MCLSNTPSQYSRMKSKILTERLHTWNKLRIIYSILHVLDSCLSDTLLQSRYHHKASRSAITKHLCKCCIIWIVLRVQKHNYNKRLVVHEIYFCVDKSQITCILPDCYSLKHDKNLIKNQSSLVFLD